MSKEAVVIRMEAKPGKARQLEELLKQALDLVKTEQGTNSWYLLKVSEVCFSVFASFDSENSAKAHLQGQIMKSIQAAVDELMVKQPDIIPVDLLASKIGDKAQLTPVIPGAKRYNLRFVDGL